MELRRAEVLDVAAGELGLHFLELFSEVVEPLGDRADPLIGHGLQFDGPQVLDLELIFAAPFNERRLGDVQLGGEPRKGPALGAEFDKPLDRFLVVHLTLPGYASSVRTTAVLTRRSASGRTVFNNDNPANKRASRPIDSGSRS